MTSYDKVVKLACKPKSAPPKAKYLDPIIAATWSEDGAVHDVCKALSPRFREPNAIIVFKALIVLHTMIRNGGTDNVLGYLATSDVLRLQNVSSGNWEGYNAPESIQNYAKYLESRIRAYRDLKHDAVRVQSETNRDLRNSMSIEDDAFASARARGRNAGGDGSNSGPQRSKTIMGRKLRVMTVDKGLLRETKAVHKMIDALVECRFYLDDLEDELTITALRMLVKDLLILFQAGNEGIINVLEHYFEMSHVDATQALAIYRHFCKQTDRAVEYLGVAKKLQNLLNVSIPTLRHAPVSLAGALQEYLDDPNFEQNRLEYKMNKGVGEVGSRDGKLKSKKGDTPQKPPSPSPPASSDKPGESSSSATAPTANQAPVDFFSAIEDESNGGQNSQQNGAMFQQVNPFSAMGFGGGQPFISQSQVQVQPTGFLAPQHTSFQQRPNLTVAQQQPQPGHRPFSSFIQSQQTGFIQPQLTAVPPQPGLGGNAFFSPTSPLPNAGGLLQPQATGANPFRQSMMVLQTTGNGVNLFGTGGVSQGQALFGAPLFGQNPSAPTGTIQTSIESSPFTVGQQGPPRPASTPLTSFGTTSNTMGLSGSLPLAQPVKTHQTGTNNPFGPFIVHTSPVPKAPTLMEIAMGGGPNGASGENNNSMTPQPQSGQANGQSSSNFSTQNQPSLMGSVASEFSFGSATQAAAKAIVPDKTGFAAFEAAQNAKLNAQNTATTNTASLFSSNNSDPLFGGSTSGTSLSSQPTGATVNSSSGFSTFSAGAPTLPNVGGLGLGAAPLNPQTTGFSGIKAFKPSSSFGASLIESLPPIPSAQSTTGAPSGLNSSAANANSNGLNGVGSHPPSFGGANFSSPQSNPGPNFVTQPVNFGGRSASANLGVASGSTGVGLRPQLTGGGTANPFRASTLGLYGSAPPAPTLPQFTGGNFGSFGSQIFGAGAFGGAIGATGGASGGQAGVQQQQQPSLI